MRWALVVLLLALVPAAAAAEPAPCVEIPVADSRCESWVARYDNPNGYGQYGWDGGRAIAADPAGNAVYVTGFSHDDTTGAWDIVTAAFDTATGQQRWVARHAGALGTFDDAMAITAAGGRVFVTGVVDTEVNQNEGNMVTLAYDAASGAPLWTAVFGADDRRERPAAIVADQSGDRVYVTGETDPLGFEGTSDILVVALDGATGAVLWDATHDGVGKRDDTGEGIELSHDGSRVFVLGTSFGHGPERSSDYDILALSFEAADPDQLGTLLWSSGYDHGSQRSDYATDIALAPDGSRLYVAGSVQRSGLSTTGYNNSDLAALALDPATGQRLWVGTWHGPNNGRSNATDLVVTSADLVVVMGSVTGYATDLDWDVATVAFRGSSGEELWHRHEGFAGATYESATGGDASADGGRVFVNGYSRQGLHEDVVTFAYDALTGEQAWSARYNDAASITNFDSGEGLAVAGNTVVAVASLRDNLAFMTNRDSTNFNYADIGILAYSL